ncbi:MAG: DoxX family protein [Phycisphaerales bacterium]
MPITLAVIRRTNALKHVIIARLIAGVPLVGIATMHLLGAAPMKPILEAAKIPLPDLNAIVAPIIELIAGLLILSGAFARIGAVLGCATMVVAIYAHMVADWADEPPIVLAIAVLLAALYVLWRGGGAWSLDAASARRVPATAAR